MHPIESTPTGRVFANAYLVEEEEHGLGSVLVVADSLPDALRGWHEWANRGRDDSDEGDDFEPESLEKLAIDHVLVHKAVDFDLERVGVYAPGSRAEALRKAVQEALEKHGSAPYTVGASVSKSPDCNGTFKLTLGGPLYFAGLRRRNTHPQSAQVAFPCTAGELPTVLADFVRAVDYYAAVNGVDLGEACRKRLEELELQRAERVRRGAGGVT